MRATGVLALAVAAALLAIPLSASGNDVDPEPDQPSILSIGGQDQMKTRNILAAMNDPWTMGVLARVYDTPVQRHPAAGALVPRLAVGIDQNGDGRLDPPELGDFTVPFTAPNVTVFYDFSNARFHDGTPVTIGSVLFSYHLLAFNQDLNGPIRVLMNGTTYPADRWLWVLPADDGDGNPATAALRFWPQFTYPDFAWATIGIPILPRQIFEETGGRRPGETVDRHVDWGRAIYPEADPRFGQGIPTSETTYKPFDYVAAEAWQMLDADVIGSGHFRFVTWSFGQFTRLDANLDYAFGRPRIDGIIFRLYRVTQLGVLALKAGEIDLYNWNVPPEFIPDLESHPNIAVVNAPPLLPATLIFNTRRQPFGYTVYPPGDSRLDDAGLPFRDAFDHLLDRATAVRALLQNYGLVADGMIAPTNDGWHNASLAASSYDPSTAASILDAAGWIDTDSDGWREFPRLGDSQFEILTPPADYDPILASTGAMLASAATSIGVNVRSRAMAFSAIIQTIAAREFDLAILSYPDMQAIDPWTLMRGDPDYLFDAFHSSRALAGRNHTGFFDTSFDAIIEAASADTDFPTRSSDIQWAESILASRLPMAPIFYRNCIFAYRTDRYAGWELISCTLLNYWSLQGLREVAPPSASFTASPNPVGVGVPVAFDASGSFDPDGTIISYAWDFGDGGAATGVTTSHAYASAGTFFVTLTVTDNDSLEDTAVGSVGVNGPNEPPVASFTASPNPVYVGVPVDFDASASFDPDGVIVSYTWDFGDGVFGSGVATSHRYGSPGTFTVTLTVLDNRSAEGTATAQVIAVENPGPEIRLASPPNESVIPPGTTIDLEIVDDDLASAAATFDSTYAWVIDPPYDVDTTNWSDGAHVLGVTAVDQAGNETARSFTFTVDGTPPAISMASPANNSRVRGGIVIDFEVSDLHLVGALVGVDTGTMDALPDPFDLPTAGIPDGTHTFRVRASDAAGNVAERSYTLTLDATGPAVTASSPTGAGVATSDSITVTFSEPVDTALAEAAFQLGDGVQTWGAADGALVWTQDRTSFTFTPDPGLRPGTKYEVRLSAGLEDDVGNPMGEDFTWSFTTAAPEGGGSPLAPWSIAAILIAVVLILLGLFALWRRRRNREEPAQPKP